MSNKVVDIHPHIISTDLQKYPRDPLGGKQSVWSQERPTDIAQMLKSMDEAGVAKAALVHSSTCYGYDNSYVADAVALHPDRFTGVFSVDMLAPDAPEKIRYWVSRKLTGLRLFTAGSTMGQQDWLDDPRTFAGWEAAIECGIPVCVQLRTSGMPQLQVLLDRFPKATFIVDHFLNMPLEEGPPYAGAEPLFDLVKYANVYLKYTPVIVNQARKGKASPDTFFPRVIKEFGAKRIAWGSNFPANAGTLKELLDNCRDAISFLSAEDQEWIFHKTSESLYPALK
jgi:L-fuconolactonase